MKKNIKNNIKINKKNYISKRKKMRFNDFFIE